MKVYATGPKKGQTFQWRSSPTADVAYQFVNGVCDLSGHGMLVVEAGKFQPRPLPHNEMAGVVQYLKVNLQVELARPTESEGTVVPSPDDNHPVRLAILCLDVEDDHLWNEQGRPTVDAVSKFIPTVTAEDIDAVASDLTREVVLKSQ